LSCPADDVVLVCLLVEVEEEEIKQDMDEKELIEGDIPWAYSNAR